MSNPVAGVTSGVPRTETPLKQGYLMLTNASLLTRVIRDISGAVERIDGRDVDRVVSCKSEGSRCASFTSDDRFQWWAT